MTSAEWQKSILEIMEMLKEKNNTVKALEFSLAEANPDEDYAVFSFKPCEWEINEYGKISGAAIASIMEISAGIVAASIRGAGIATDLNISFLRELSADKDFTVKVYIVKAGRKIFRLRQEIFDGTTGKLSATATMSSMAV